MKTNIVVRSMIGLGYGGIFTFIYMTILNASIHDDGVFRIWLTTLDFMLIGLYFAFSSSIFGQENWSMLKRTIIHFLLSIVVFHVIMLGSGVQSLNVWSVLMNLFIFVLIYIGSWTGFYLYYKKLFKDMNNSIE